MSGSDGERPPPDGHGEPRRTPGTVQTADGLELRYSRWLAREPRAALAIAHGVGEHGGRYEWLGTHLASRGIAVYAVDHRGHGTSPGPRAHVDRWHRYGDDFERFLERVAREAVGRPVFALGHSMGALIALEAAIRRGEPAAIRRGEAAAVRRGGADARLSSDEHPPPERVPLAGVVASAAPLRPTGLAKPHLVLIARVLSRAFPRFTLDLGIDPPALSRDPEVGRRYEEDPLVARRATVRWGTEALRAVEWVVSNASSIRTPLLILHGESDRLVLPDGSRWLAREVGSPRAELKLYPGGYHEPHNDLCRDEVERDIAAWIERITRLPREGEGS